MFTVERLLSVARCSFRFRQPARSSNAEIIEQVIFERASARRQKSSARESFLAISMSTSVSTKVLGSVATTFQLLPQRPPVGSAITNIRSTFPHAAEWGFEKTLSHRAFQPHPFFARDGRFGQRPNDIQNDAQPRLRNSLQSFNNLIYKGFLTPRHRHPLSCTAYTLCSPESTCQRTRLHGTFSRHACARVERAVTGSGVIFAR